MVANFQRGVRVDRAFKPGEIVAWEGCGFTVDWMPGQTESVLCLHGMIDGRKVAFTGGNLFGVAQNAKLFQNRHFSSPALFWRHAKTSRIRESNLQQRNEMDSQTGAWKL
jgi:hypothetical protein